MLTILVPEIPYLKLYCCFVRLYFEMIKMRFILVLYFCFLIKLISNKYVDIHYHPLRPTEAYLNSLEADEDEPDVYRIFWKILDDNETIQFEVHCRVRGWVGLGISPNGDMRNSDIAIGWVDDNGKAYLVDTYAVSKSSPIVDPIQDWELISGSETDDYTILKFKRKLITCDENDFQIKKETHRLIFAWHDTDPSPELNDWMYHGPNRRIRSTNLYEIINFDESEKDDDSENTMKYEFKIEQLPIPPKQTYYFCQFYKLPEIKEDLHMTGVNIKIDRDSRDLIHHLDVYECDTDEEITDDKIVGKECGPVNNNYVRYNCFKREMITNWVNWDFF